ncbi:MAG TPA: DNA alkylation repair protein [Frankiaceae bacterium]|nr:DNA alkylation repair protein [Frankiaceae bacterium]
MADFKDEISPALVAALAAELRGAWPAFPVESFTARATDGLAPLALMERVRHVAGALGETLPARFADAARVLDRAVDSATFTGWMTLPCGEYVAAHGIDEPHVALPLLARLTPKFSSEAPIRPFVERHPDVTFGYLREWTRSDDEHVRRLVSEGTRPRLPWASRLRGLVEDPAPAVALLDVLYDDPSLYVRRSVANHLNDIAKDHPALALEIARRWQASGGDGAAWVVRHGLRTLVKRGDPEALGLLGFDHAAAVRLASLTVSPARLPIGGEATIELTLTADRATRVVVDYVVHHAGARGTRAPKVFKLTSRTIDPAAPERIVRRHRFREVSVRRLYPGPHRVEIQVNGRVLGGADVELFRPDDTG